MIFRLYVMSDDNGDTPGSLMEMAQQFYEQAEEEAILVVITDSNESKVVEVTNTETRVLQVNWLLAASDESDTGIHSYLVFEAN